MRIGKHPHEFHDLMKSDTVIYCDFRCFYVVFSLLFLIFFFFRIYFHGADNWSMNYRHHDFLHLKLIYARKHWKNLFALARNIFPAIAENRVSNKAK